MVALDLGCFDLRCLSILNGTVFTIVPYEFVNQYGLERFNVRETRERDSGGFLREEQEAYSLFIVSNFNDRFGRFPH